jgi:hypothetical protein
MEQKPYLDLEVRVNGEKIRVCESTKQESCAQKWLISFSIEDILGHMCAPQLDGVPRPR